MALEKIRLKHGSPEWLAFRRTGIGGSDAAAILGLSPFKSNIEVWEEKVGLREPEDISDKPQVQYGTRAEDMLVKLFALDYPQYKVRQDKQTVYRRGFMFASLDGELTEIETKARGFIENTSSSKRCRPSSAKAKSRVVSTAHVPRPCPRAAAPKSAIRKLALRASQSTSLMTLSPTMRPFGATSSRS